MSALLIGLLAGVVCFAMVTRVKARLGYDDSLDAFGVHGVGGTIGALLTGVFASKLINPVFKDERGTVLGSGMIDGNFLQIFNQLVGVVVAVVLAVIGTLAILKLVDLLIGLRVPAEQEIEGLDINQHGEEGYNWEGSAP
jgi:Amt family ammonium transporter